MAGLSRLQDPSHGAQWHQSLLSFFGGGSIYNLDIWQKHTVTRCDRVDVITLLYLNCFCHFSSVYEEMDTKLFVFSSPVGVCVLTFFSLKGCICICLGHFFVLCLCFYSGVCVLVVDVGDQGTRSVTLWKWFSAWVPVSQMFLMSCNPSGCFKGSGVILTANQSHSSTPPQAPHLTNTKQTLHSDAQMQFNAGKHRHMPTEWTWFSFLYSSGLHTYTKLYGCTAFLNAQLKYLIGYCQHFKYICKCFIWICLCLW